MEGLEAVELNSNEFLIDNFDFRLDAEYFLKENLLKLNLLKRVGYKSISDFCYVTDGIHTSIDYSEDSKINLFSATTPRENYFDLSRQVFISEKAQTANPRTALRVNDVIISTVGTIGNCAVVDENVLPANSDRHVGIIRIEKDFYPRFLSTFLLSKYGRFQTWRESTGNVQLNLFLYRIRTLKIADLSHSFQKIIEDLVLLNDLKRKQSQEYYYEAEQILLEEIGLDEKVTGLNPVEITESNPFLSAPNYNVKSLKDSLGTTGRLDAEYYQKKYEVVIEKIKAYKNGFEPLSVACNLKDKNFSPIENEEYKYIELSNIGKTGDVTGCKVELGKDLPSRARRLVNTDDVVISSIEGSLQSCGLIGKEYNNSLCSTGFYVINSEKINSETLIVLFKSPLMQSIMKQNCSGTILTGMNKDEFQNILVPLIDINAQTKIAKLIEQSFSLKKQSEDLLEVAKRAVEIAIEENEEVAMRYIQERLGE